MQHIKHYKLMKKVHLSLSGQFQTTQSQAAIKAFAEGSQAPPQAVPILELKQSYTTLQIYPFLHDFTNKKNQNQQSRAQCTDNIANFLRKVSYRGPGNTYWTSSQ